MTDLLAIFGPLTPALTAWADELNLAAAELRGALPHDVPPIEPAKLMRLAAEYLRARRTALLTPELQRQLVEFGAQVRMFMLGKASPARALELHAQLDASLAPNDPRRFSIEALRVLLDGDPITAARRAVVDAITAAGGSASPDLPLIDLLLTAAAQIRELAAAPEQCIEVEPGLGMAPEQDAEGREMEGKAHALLFAHDEPLPATCPTCGHNNERCASPTISCDGCGTVFTVEG